MESMETGGNSTPLPKTPEPMVTKLGVRDDVGSPYLSAKFHHDPIGVFAPRPRARVQSDSAS